MDDGRFLSYQRKPGAQVGTPVSLKLKKGLRTANVIAMEAYRHEQLGVATADIFSQRPLADHRSASQRGVKGMHPPRTGVNAPAVWGPQPGRVGYAAAARVTS